MPKNTNSAPEWQRAKRDIAAWLPGINYDESSKRLKPGFAPEDSISAVKTAAEITAKVAENPFVVVTSKSVIWTALFFEVFTGTIQSIDNYKKYSEEKAEADSCFEYEESQKRYDPW